MRAGVSSMIFRDLPKKAIIIILVGLFMIIGGVALFIEIADDIIEKEKFQVDHYFQHVFLMEEGDIFHQMMGIITEAGAVLFLTIASGMVVIYMFFTKKNKWMILFFAINMIGISIITKGLKEIFKRERPEILEQFDGTGFSFPSGHSTGAIAFYGFIIYMLWKSNLRSWLKWLFIIILGILAIMIPFSRVILGVHYFTDIIAGMALSSAWLILCIIVFEYLSWRESKGN